MNIKIYTDGSCLGNPGAGGYAAIILYEDGKLEEIIGGERFTTNNRMELMAAIIALRKISPQDKAEIFTDSAYLKNAFTQNWLDNWKRNGWKSSKKDAVKNQDLWKELDFLISHLNVTFHWVKGHAGNEFNERCDKLARKTAESLKTAQSATPSVSSAKTNMSTDEKGRTWSDNQLLLFDEEGS